jgi:hypothetical protein
MSWSRFSCHKALGINTSAILRSSQATAQIVHETASQRNQDFPEYDRRPNRIFDLTKNQFSAKIAPN